MGLTRRVFCASLSQFVEFEKYQNAERDPGLSQGEVKPSERAETYESVLSLSSPASWYSVGANERYV